MTGRAFTVFIIMIAGAIGSWCLVFWAAWSRTP
ncbi:hypothetical protein C8P69_101536 [Phreatobacter oligotrophus]|uniref:Uncharacterized protein n=1 Tax=Phreatobacter oligotrophus TaxID=1122261 RepID=A0A2T4ZIS6_9HYPH|nr:hypothetical protein C8P69_101536 [Phreatobacter oligotrophus]